VGLQQAFELIGGGDRPVARTQAGTDHFRGALVRRILQKRLHGAADLVG
jgi:hypothetical protein